MAKNVAADVAKNICDSVTNKLEGKICGTTFLFYILLFYFVISPIIISTAKKQ